MTVTLALQLLKIPISHIAGGERKAIEIES